MSTVWTFVVIPHFQLWKEYTCRVNIVVQYHPLKYSESPGYTCNSTTMWCVFSNAEVEFSFPKTNWTKLSIFHFKYFFLNLPTVYIFSPWNKGMLHCQNHTKSYGQLHGQHCTVTFSCWIVCQSLFTIFLFTALWKHQHHLISLPVSLDDPVCLTGH